MTRSLLFATLLVLCLPLALRAGEVSDSPPPATLRQADRRHWCRGLSRRESDGGDPPQG